MATGISMTNTVAEPNRNAALLSLRICPANHPGNSGLLLQRCVYKTWQGTRPYKACSHAMSPLRQHMVSWHQPSNKTATVNFPYGHHHSSFFKETNKMNLPGGNISAKKKNPKQRSQPRSKSPVKESLFSTKEKLCLILGRPTASLHVLPMPTASGFQNTQWSRFCSHLSGMRKFRTRLASGRGRTHTQVSLTVPTGFHTIHCEQRWIRQNLTLTFKLPPHPFPLV